MSDSIIIERIFDAPIEKIWDMWTKPELVQKWWGPEGFSAPSIKIDLRVGGKYIYAMRGPAGSEWDKVMYSAGEYQEIIAPSASTGHAKIVATDYFCDEAGNKLEPTDYGQDTNFPSEMVVTVTFEETEANKTKLSIIYPKPENEAHFQAMLKSGMQEGWQSSLDKLAHAL